MGKHLVLCLMATIIGGCEAKRTYSEGCGAMPAGWITPREGRDEWSIPLEISIDDRARIFFGRRPSTERQLIEALRTSRGLNPAAVIRIAFSDRLDCDLVEHFRKIVAENADCSRRRCAEGAGHWWLFGDVPTGDAAPEPYDPQASRSLLPNSRSAATR